MGMVLDPARVHQKTRFGLSPPFRGLFNGVGTDPGDLRRPRRRPFLHARRQRVKADGVFLDELVIEPVPFDHEVQDAIEKGHIPSGFDRQKQITRPRNRCDTWIDDDDLRTIFARLPDIFCRNGCALSDIGSTDPYEVSLGNIAPRIGRAIDSKGLLIARRRAHHAQPTVVVNIGSPKSESCELPNQVRFFSRQTRTREDGKGICTMFGLDALDGTGNPCNRRLVFNRMKPACRRFIALQRRKQTIRMRSLEIPLHTLGTEHPAIERKLQPRFESNDLFVLYL
jgi:hypothetical protein